MTALPVATLTDLLRVRAETLGGQAAYGFLADGETGNETATLTYADLDRHARQLAARLRERVTPGASVLLAYPPGLEFIVGFFGCLHAGVIAVPVCAPHPRKGNERLSAIAIDCGARHVLTTSAGVRHYAAAAAQVAQLGALEVIATEHDRGDAHATGSTVTPRSDAVAFLQYTSGSTQRPRGVMVTHANLIANLGAIHAAEGNSAASRGVSWLPAYHDMGLIEGILQPLYGGYPTWLMPHTAFLQRPARWLQAIARCGATVSGGPNFAYDLCLRRVDDRELDGLDLGCWQVAYCGAEPVRAETLAAFANRFGRFGLKRSALRPVYGLAESTLLVTASKRDAPGPRIVAARKSGLEQGRFEAVAHDAVDRSLLVSCGTPARGTRLSIVAPETRTVLPDGMLPDGAIGEIRVCGPSVARGYRSDGEGDCDVFVKTLIAGVEGVWLRTGDLGFLLDQELYITGRAKDLIILRGRKLHPQDIEHTIMCSAAQSQIEALAAFALDADGGEGLAICVELSRSGSLTETGAHERAHAALWDPGDLSDLADTIRDRVYREHDIAVTLVAFVRPGALARTSSGKLMRYQCRADLTSGQLPIVASFDARSSAAVGVRVT